METHYFAYCCGHNYVYLLIEISKDVYHYCLSDTNNDFCDKYIIFETIIELDKIYLVELPPLKILSFRSELSCIDKSYGIKFIDDLKYNKKKGYYYCPYNSTNIGILIPIKHE